MGGLAKSGRKRRKEGGSSKAMGKVEREVHRKLKVEE